MVIGKIGALNAAERQRAEPRQLSAAADGAGMGILDNAIAESRWTAASSEISKIRPEIQETSQQGPREAITAMTLFNWSVRLL